MIFLDEVTSGMDVSAQRDTWTLLKRMKEGRIIVLTTHSMEEADTLGDRIGIMCGGKMVCEGSPLFLKRAYGVGYQLRINFPPFPSSSSSLSSSSSSSSSSPSSPSSSSSSSSSSTSILSSSSSSSPSSSTSSSSSSSSSVKESDLAWVHFIRQSLPPSCHPKISVDHQISRRLLCLTLPLEASPTFPMIFYNLDLYTVDRLEGHHDGHYGHQHHHHHHHQQQQQQQQQLYHFDNKNRGQPCLGGGEPSKIQSYNISTTTIQEVFVKAVTENNVQCGHHHNNNNNNNNNNEISQEARGGGGGGGSGEVGRDNKEDKEATGTAGRWWPKEEGEIDE